MKHKLTYLDGRAKYTPVGYFGHIPVYTNNINYLNDDEYFTLDVSSIEINVKHYLCDNLYLILSKKATDSNTATFHVVDGTNTLYSSSKVTLLDTLDLYFYKNASNQLTLKRVGNVNVVSFYNYLSPFISLNKPSNGNTSSETSYSICGNILQNIIDGVKSTCTPVSNVEIILDAISNQNTSLTIVPKTNFEELLYKYLKKDKTNLPNPTTLDEIILHSKISGASINITPETSVQILLNKLKNI